MVKSGGTGVGMSKEVAQSYRNKAVECLTIAERTSDPIERIELLQIARGYLRLADHVTASHARALTNMELEEGNRDIDKDLN
jgi:hypothetical protein